MYGINSAVKPQFGSWLLEQVRSGTYDGLHMINTDTFRIPWKHNSRKDCGDDDNRIFREWAVVSGKISENPNDKAKWKTNFRCALNNLKQFQMIEDHSKESRNPHKIYRIIQPQNPQSYPSNHTENTYSSAEEASEAMEHDDLSNHMDMLHLNQPAVVIPQWQACQQQNPVIQNNYIAMPFVPQPSIMNNISAPSPDLLQPSYSTGQQHVILPYIHELEITIHYRRLEMMKVHCSNAVVQLHTQCDISDLRGESVHFPSTEALTDRKQIQFTKRILDNIKRGLLLKVCPNGIYGYRQDNCNCNVFTSTSDPTDIQNQPEHRKLLQNHDELLLSFDKYKKDLIDFKENRRGSPDYTIYLCFGEKFPDGKPLEKKLIIVKVVPLICRELYKAAQLEGASSLQNDNISLQFSYNSLFELIEATFPLPIAE